MGLNTLCRSNFADFLVALMRAVYLALIKAVCFMALIKAVCLMVLRKAVLGSAKFVKRGIDSNSSGETRWRDAGEYVLTSPSVEDE